MELFGRNATGHVWKEEDCWVSSKEHHKCEEWGWKHHGSGLLSCKGEGTTDLHNERMNGAMYCMVRIWTGWF